MRVSVRVWIAAALVAGCAAPTDVPEPDAPPDLARCERLDGGAIRAAFRDVEDRAVVHESGGRARNRWCADGRFVSTWETAAGTGSLHGRWRVDGDRRCVAVERGLPGGDTERCSVLLRCGDQVASLNADGTLHGLHSLSPTDCSVPFAPILSTD